MSSARLIYALFDPRTGHCRYIGLSTRGLARPRVHLRRVPDKDRTHRANWLRNLKAEGLQPEIRVVEYCIDDDDVSAGEAFWVEHFRQAGCPLTNHQAGGFDGRPDDSTKARIAAALRGHKRPVETVERMSVAKRGAKNPMFGQPVSVETRAKRAVSLSGEKNPRFGLVPPNGEATRFVKGQEAWNKGLPGLAGEAHPMFGKRHADDVRARISAAKKGRSAWNKGKAMSDEHRANLSHARTGSKMKCSCCGVAGHNRQTCSALIAV